MGFYLQRASFRHIFSFFQAMLRMINSRVGSIFVALSLAVVGCFVIQNYVEKATKVEKRDIDKNVGFAELCDIFAGI